jgi:hypothetical protein
MKFDLKKVNDYILYREDFNEVPRVHGSALHRFRGIAGRQALANFVDDSA